MRILTKKNLNGKKVNILLKRLLDGPWKMEYLLNSRMLVDIEKKNKSSKWITYSALKTLYKSRYLEKK